MGSTKHSMDWSLNSITPPDYKDLVLNGGIGESEALGSQAIAAVSLIPCLINVLGTFTLFRYFGPPGQGLERER